MVTLEAALSAAYALREPLVALPGELDLNFACGDHLVKVHRQDTAAGRLDAMDAPMVRVADRLPGRSMPRPVAATDGSMRVPVDDGILRVLTWVPGRPLAEVDDPTPETLT